MWMNPATVADLLTRHDRWSPAPQCAFQSARMRSSISSWLTDDPEFLRATLELIDTWSETSNVDLVTSSASPSSSDGHESTSSEHEELLDNGVESSTHDRVRTKLHALSKTATTPRGTKTNLSTNQRRRQEIRVLQNQIRAMEAQVAALQTGRERLSVGHSPQKLLLLWHQIAENQRRLRNKSEFERVKLRKLLQDHASIAKGMTQLMQKAQVLKDAAVMQSLSQEQTVSSSLHDDQCLDQFERVELMYFRMDAVFAHGHFRDGSSSFVDAEIVNDLERKVVLEFRETFTVPFEPLEVLDALWSFTKKRYETKWKSPGQQVLVDTADSFLTQFSTRGAIDESLFSFAGQLLLRRFDQKTAESTPAIVTNMMSAPNKNGGSLQIWMDEHACSRLASLGGRSPLTRVQCYHHVSVQFDEDDVVTSRLHATTLLNFVVDKLQSDIQVKQNFIETFLLQLR